MAEKKQKKRESAPKRGVCAWLQLGITLGDTRCPGSFTKASGEREALPARSTGVLQHRLTRSNLAIGNTRLGRTAAPHCACHHEARLEISLLVRVTEKLALLLIEHG